MTLSPGADPATPRRNGFAKVPHEETGTRDMSDAAFRVWVALGQWTWNGRFPTNAQLAAACGWFNDHGVPSAWKAKRTLRELESLGKVRRVTSTDANGRHIRVGIEVVRVGGPCPTPGTPPSEDRGRFKCVAQSDPERIRGMKTGKTRVSVPYAIISRPVLADTCLSPSDKVVLLALQQWGRGKRECFPGVLTIAKAASVSRKTVMRCLKALRDRGFIEIRADKTNRTGRRLILVWMNDPRLHPFPVGINEQTRVEELRAMSHGDYLKTPEWADKRSVALSAAGGRCQVCNSSISLNVHHRTYERFGEELAEDLIVLCRQCHKMFHTNGKLAEREDVPAPEPTPHPFSPCATLGDLVRALAEHRGIRESLVSATARALADDLRDGPQSWRYLMGLCERVWDGGLPPEAILRPHAAVMTMLDEGKPFKSTPAAYFTRSVENWLREHAG